MWCTVQMVSDGQLCFLLQYDDNDNDNGDGDNDNSTEIKYLLSFNRPRFIFLDPSRIVSLSGPISNGPDHV
jgi:hypothetical protein